MASSRMKSGQGSHQGFPTLLSLARISRIPVVESSLQYATDMYTRVKHTNSLISWGLSTAESSMHVAFHKTLPVVAALEWPIGMIDSLLCCSLDLLEERVPVVTLPPELILVSTKEYVNHSIVAPVLKHADTLIHTHTDSLKQLGRDALKNKYTEFAADQLDHALDVADKYVDHYLPDSFGQGESPVDDFRMTANHASSKGGATKAAHTIQHVDRFSRKLQRRLTQRTLMEARALKQGGQDTLHFLVLLAELFARDPKAVYQLALKLWAELSEDEPENQTPPANLEQLTVMLTRETARRIVHLINYTYHGMVALPHTVSIKMHTLVLYYNQLQDMLLKATHFEEVKHTIISEAKLQLAKKRMLVDEINTYVIQILEWVAGIIAGKPDVMRKPGNAQNQNQNGSSPRLGKNNLNSID